MAFVTANNEYGLTIQTSQKNIISQKLHVVPFPGLFLRINKILMYSGGSVIDIFNKDSLFLTTSDSFISDDGSIMLYSGPMNIPMKCVPNALFSNKTQ